MIRPIAATAESVEECDEALRHISESMALADGELRDLIREDLELMLDRRYELTHG